MKKQSIVLLLSCIAFIGTMACKKNYKNPHVVIQSVYGDIEIELYPDKAPKSVAAFLGYVDSGYYKSCNFYRILSLDNQVMGSNASELIQGGLWANKNGNHNELKGIVHESTNITGLKHTNGTISLARQEPGTATTEFFIVIGDQPGFDYGGQNNPDKQGYAAFGRVVEGMDVVLKIYAKPEQNQFFDPPVKINNIKRL